MHLPDGFGSDYFQARSRFREAVEAEGGVLQAIMHPDAGPGGRDLTMDIAWFGPVAAEAVLVLLSGTHGVEGFCGSGAQVAALKRGEFRRLPGGVAVMMVHAVNPYGFAWLRRVTHENIDLNRNWIDFSRPLPENPAYDALAEALCPPIWTQESLQASQARFGGFIAEHGYPAFQAGVTGGQHRHPSGLFFGGVAPSWSRTVLTDLLVSRLGRAARIAVIDYHTGLGPWGFGERMVMSPPGSPEFERARAWYGEVLTCPGEGSPTAEAIQGDMLSALPRLLPNAEITAMALEIGVLPPEITLDALRADAWLSTYGDPDSQIGRSIRKQMRDAFYGDADDWKGMVAVQSLLLCRQAIVGLARA